MSRRAPGAAPGPAASQLSLFRQADALPPTPANARTLGDADDAARAFAVDPRHNVVLEASAGTGKTSVLVSRYLNLIKAGVDPTNILAMTFTRKAAAEMRERIVRELRTAAERSELDKARWLELRNRVGDIAIGTIDAFCLALLREFPLEADIDPAFELADETDVPRLMSIALDRTLRIVVRLSGTDEDVRLALAQLGTSRTREGLANLLDRRLVAWDALDRFLARGPRDLTPSSVSRAAAEALQRTLAEIPGGLFQFLADGPSAHTRYELFLREVKHLTSLPTATEASIRGVLERIAAHFLTGEGKARKPGTAIPPYKAEHYPSRHAMKRHRDAVFDIAPRVEHVLFAFNRDLNVVLARGVKRMFAIALEQYRRALDERSVLDFSDVLQRALGLLRRMDEFSQSRYRLESRYHHVLVDEFQDTSRAQWELVSLLVQAWGEGLGLATHPSIFIVGDRKQSIYRFRDAEVVVLHEAAQYIEALRPHTAARRSISRSFRACAELLHFVNDVFSEMSQPAHDATDFTYEERDRFPVDSDDAGQNRSDPALGVTIGETVDECAAAVADEIVRLLREGTVRDKRTGVTRSIEPGDVGILFRSRSSHREFERELGARGVPTYVYKGLGFFDADEIKDVMSLVRYLADPASELRAAAFLRSRFIRLSDAALARLAPNLAAALGSDLPLSVLGSLDAEDRTVLAHARPYVQEWLNQVDRVAPAELLEQILFDTAYAWELGGPRRRQAWENLKKMRGLVRRMQNRGYATLRRISDYLDSLSTGDESNAVIEALGSVNLMTVHAAKGLEFPVVFVVNLAKGASGPPRPFRVVVDSDWNGASEPSVSIGQFTADMDEDERERERERHETRRLLYVALTRARDRLYLASTLKDGVFAPGRGSLAEVMPDSLKKFFATAPATFKEVDTLGWTGVSGRDYRWRLCRPEPHVGETTQEKAGVPNQALPDRSDDFDAPAARPPLVRASASEWVALSSADYGQRPIQIIPRSDRLFGRVIHRLFELVADECSPEIGALTALARRVLRPDELVMLADVEAFAVRAAETWLRARSRQDVVAALTGTDRLYEVPFSMRLDPTTLLRGTIDCLVRDAGGRLTVVEFKTGCPRDTDRRQLELYTEAARRLMAANRAGDTAAADVRGLLLYL